MTALHRAPTSPLVAIDATGGRGVTVRPGLLSTLSKAVLINGQASNPAPQVLRTRRLLLRPLETGDRAEFLRAFNASRKYLSRFCPLSRDDADRESAEAIFERQVEYAQRAVATGRAWRMTAFDAEGRMAGAFNINDISRGLESTGELVCWINIEHANSGIASEGLKATINHAFTDLPRGLGLDKLTALIAPDNAASIKVSRKIGMRLMTDAPPQALMLNGRPVLHDSYVIYAPVTGLVEGKPSIAESIFGRGLLSILKTESSRQPAQEQ